VNRDHLGIGLPLFYKPPLVDLYGRLGLLMAIYPSILNSMLKKSTHYPQIFLIHP
jgi:hypothetical protein